MTLDEAIQHCKEKSCGDSLCAKEHKELAGWLQELKQYRLLYGTVSEDLENEIVRWEDSFKYCSASMGYKETAIHFANWQKEQIIAKTIDGEILEVEDNDCAICSHTHLELCIEPDTLEKNGFKDNDKVKVFVIKEN